MDRIIIYLCALLLVVSCNAMTRCYNFNSTKDIHATVIICDDSCLKKIVKNDKNEEFLVQTCGPVVSKEEEELQCKTGEKKKTFEHICLCRGEYCNPAAKANVSFRFVLWAMVVFLLLA